MSHRIKENTNAHDLHEEAKIINNNKRSHAMYVLYILNFSFVYVWGL